MGEESVNGGRRVREQEAKAGKREEADRERLQRLETIVYSQNEKLDRLEDLVCAVVEGKVNDEGTTSRRLSSDYDHENYKTASTSWQSDLNDHSTTTSPQKAASARHFAIPEF